MPPKASKAQVQQKAKIAEDKTFGMKNKNKSKVVQKYIKNITQNATGHSGKRDQEERKQKEDKEKAKQNSALLNSLFNMQTDKKGRAYDPVAKKKAKEAEEQAIASGKGMKNETKKEIIEGIANSIRLTNPKGIRMSELGGHPIIQALKEKHADTFKTIQMLLFIKAQEKVFWVSDPDDNNPIIRCQDDVDAEVEPDERPIEEIIEEKRRALPPGGTPVTPETFKAWKEKKEKERTDRIEAERENAGKKGKDKVAMSGRDLFIFDSSLFVDDDGAASANEYEERSEPGDDEDDDDRGAARGAAGANCAAEESGDEEEQEEEEEQEAGEEETEEPDAGAGEEAAGSSEAAKASGAAANAAGAAASASSGAVEINKELFLQGGDDLPDDLDDLDD